MDRSTYLGKVAATLDNAASSSGSMRLVDPPKAGVSHRLDTIYDRLRRINSSFTGVVAQIQGARPPDDCARPKPEMTCINDLIFEIESLVTSLEESAGNLTAAI